MGMLSKIGPFYIYGGWASYQSPMTDRRSPQMAQSAHVDWVTIIPLSLFCPAKRL